MEEQNKQYYSNELFLREKLTKWKEHTKSKELDNAFRQCNTKNVFNPLWLLIPFFIFGLSGGFVINRYYKINKILYGLGLGLIVLCVICLITLIVFTILKETGYKYSMERYNIDEIDDKIKKDNALNAYKAKCEKLYKDDSGWPWSDPLTLENIKKTYNIS